MHSVADMKNPEQRFLTILRWMLATLRTTPKKGIMAAKPYNPVLGEEFHCCWQHKDSFSTFLAEQVSHHPPVRFASLPIIAHRLIRSTDLVPPSLSLSFPLAPSAFYMENRKKNIVFEGDIKPKSKVRRI